MGFLRKKKEPEQVEASVQGVQVAQESQDESKMVHVPIEFAIYEQLGAISAKLDELLKIAKE